MFTQSILKSASTAAPASMLALWEQLPLPSKKQSESKKTGNKAGLFFICNWNEKNNNHCLRPACMPQPRSGECLSQAHQNGTALPRRADLREGNHRKRRRDYLRGRRIDLAMLPLDPRLGEPGFWGPRHFLELADIRRFLPMHQWGDFGFTEKFLAEYPAFAPLTLPVAEAGQVFEYLSIRRMTL